MKKVKFAPKLVIFDVDGVLVDVRGSFHGWIIDTVHHFTGRRVTYADIQQWKRRSGYNDDWRLTTDWVNELGVSAEYAKVKREFQKFYWGVNGSRGNVWREKWPVPKRRLDVWAERAELALFTGRSGANCGTLERFGMSKVFRRIVTMDDVERLKPDPEGCTACSMEPTRARHFTSETFWTSARGEAGCHSVPGSSAARQ